MMVMNMSAMSSYYLCRVAWRTLCFFLYTNILRDVGSLNIGKISFLL